MRDLLILGLALSCGIAGGCGKDETTSPAPVTPVVAADLVARPSRGTIITDFTLDASGTTCNVDGLRYRWDWKADAVWDTDWQAASSQIHRFAGADTCRVFMEARVGEVSDRDTAEVTLDNRHGELIESIPIPLPIQNPRGVAFDGDAFWLADWGAPGTHSLYRIDPASGAALDTLLAPSTWPGGLVWDGSALWVADYSGGARLFRVDPQSGDVLESFPVVYSASGSGLAWTGDGFYFASDRGDTEGDGDIHRYARDGAHLGAFDAPQGSEHPDGLGYDGVNLWVTIEGSDSLYVVDPRDGSPRGSVHAGRRIGSFTFVEGYLWTHYRDGGPWLGRIVP
jgi:hypothetical protein